MQKEKDIFGQWWAIYSERPRKERIAHYNSLSRDERKQLAKSLFRDGWARMFFQNELDNTIDELKRTTKVDMMNMRVKVIVNNEIYMMDKTTWEHIIEKVGYFTKYCNLYHVLGGLSIKTWGKDRQFCIISKKH